MSVSPSSHKRKAWDLNPYLREEARISSAARQTVSGYLPNQSSGPTGNRTRRVFQGIGRHARAASARWTISPFAFSGPHGSRTHHTDLARVSRPQRHAGPSCREVRPGIEPGLLPYHGSVRPKHLQTNFKSDPGWNRTITLLHVTQASSPLDHGTIRVTEAGVEPAKSPRSQRDRFACLRTRP